MYVKSVVARGIRLGVSQQDIVATVTGIRLTYLYTSWRNNCFTALTAAVIEQSYETHIRHRLQQWPTTAQDSSDLFVSGGGAHNTTLMRSLPPRQLLLLEE